MPPHAPGEKKPGAGAFGGGGIDFQKPGAGGGGTDFENAGAGGIRGQGALPPKTCPLYVPSPITLEYVKNDLGETVFWSKNGWVA